MILAHRSKKRRHQHEIQKEVRMAQNIPPNQVIYPENVSGLKKAWTCTTGDAIESSPVVAGGIVYIGSKDHALYALDARTGAEIWSYTTGGAIYSTPTVVDDVVYIGSRDANLYAFEARTGALLWSYTTGNGTESSPRSEERRVGKAWIQA